MGPGILLTGSLRVIETTRTFQRLKFVDLCEIIEARGVTESGILVHTKTAILHEEDCVLLDRFSLGNNLSLLSKLRKKLFKVLTMHGHFSFSCSRTLGLSSTDRNYGT
jgi:hypothetical protein